MPTVFLSHSSHDAAFAAELAARLREDPTLTVWLDLDSIFHGANIVTAISEGLRRADFLLFLASLQSIRSNALPTRYLSFRAAKWN